MSCYSTTNKENSLSEQRDKQKMACCFNNDMTNMPFIFHDNILQKNILKDWELLHVVTLNVIHNVGEL